MPAAALQLGCCRLQGPVLIPQQGAHRTNSLHTGRTACTQDEQLGHRTNIPHTGRTAWAQDEHPAHRTNSLGTGRTAWAQDEHPAQRTNSLGLHASTHCPTNGQTAHSCVEEEKKKKRDKTQNIAEKTIKKRGETVQGRGGFIEVQKHT